MFNDGTGTSNVTATDFPRSNIIPTKSITCTVTSIKSPTNITTIKSLTYSVTAIKAATYQVTSTTTKYSEKGSLTHSSSDSKWPDKKVRINDIILIH
jgi:predicted amidohydrolase YtcJ